LNNQRWKGLFVSYMSDVSKLPGILYHRCTFDVLLILVVFWWTSCPLRLSSLYTVYSIVCWCC
jgi:hypothetical protein